MRQSFLRGSCQEPSQLQHPRVVLREGEVLVLVQRLDRLLDDFAPTVLLEHVHKQADASVGMDGIGVVLAI